MSDDMHIQSRFICNFLGRKLSSLISKHVGADIGISFPDCICLEDDGEGKLRLMAEVTVKMSKEELQKLLKTL